jgi:thiamine biosynthesis protein ThiS
VITLDGKRMPWRRELTLAQLLQEMGNAHQYAVVRVNDRYVSRPGFDTYVIPDNAVIFLVPMIAGG